MSGFFSKRTILRVLGILLTAVLLYIILPVTVPLIAALITALLLEPAVQQLQLTIKIDRRIAVVAVFILFVLFVGTAGYFVTVNVVTEGIDFVENAPNYINEVSKMRLRSETQLINAASELPDELVKEISKRVQLFLSSIQENLTAYVNLSNVKALLTNIPNYLVSFLVYLIALFLFSLDLPRLRERVNSHLKEETADKVNFMASRFSYVLFGFIKAQLLVSAIIFFIALLFLLFIHPDIAPFMSLLIWLFDFIPLIGSFIILGPWSLFYLLTGNMFTGMVLAVLAILLLIIHRTVEPKIMGSHIGLSPLSTLVAIYLGLKLFGILGIIIGPLLFIAFNSAKEAGIIKLKFKL